jgi:hypothetical protein
MFSQIGILPLINVLIKWWQSLTPVLKFSDLKQDLLLLVSIDKIRLLNESCDNVTDIDIEYDLFECEVSKVIDKHVPVKHR